MAMAEKAVEWRARQAPYFRIGSREARLRSRTLSPLPPASEPNNQCNHHMLVLRQEGMRVLRQHASDLQRDALCLSLSFHALLSFPSTHHILVGILRRTPCRFILTPQNTRDLAEMPMLHRR